MGGSKGQSTQQTNQTQTYSPNAQAAGYMTDALSRAQQTASLPFSVPQAPVAGFSGLQNQGFGAVSNAQGMASPYYQQAANYFSPQGAQQFFNPYADAVTAQMKNIFGQQNTQNTANLTQAAGGVGADRIAVGQANLANQQGLAAGQTYANLYQQAVQQAQQAGQNYQNLGTTAQNTALQGAQALLGAGGQQQQLAQAQLNAPYQQQVAQAQFPYQQAQWYGNLVGALAPGLGGTTQGTGTSVSTPAQPSIWSQILGGGLAAAGGLGQSGAFGSNGWLTGSSPSYGGGNVFSGDAYGGNSANPLPGLSASDYGAGFAEGGEVSDEPIDIAAHPFISPGQMHAIQPHVPQLNLNPPQQSGGGGGGGGIGDVIGMAAKIIPFLAQGGAIRNPYADGGDTGFGAGEASDADRSAGLDLLRAKMLDQGYVPQNNPIRMPDQAATDAWRKGVDAGQSDGQSLALSPEVPPSPLPTADTAAASPAVPPEQAAAALSFAPGHSHDRSGFMDSPWAALTAAGLGIMGGTSPFAGVNIGQGGQKGLAMLQQQRENAQKDETTEQAARRLEQEAQNHLDSLTKMSPYQQAQIDLKKADQEGTGTTVKDIVDAIESGDQPPTLTGLYGKSAAVRAEASRRGVPLSRLQLQYSAAQKQIASLNGPQMTRFAGLATSVDKTIDEVGTLADQMKNSGIPILNRAKLAALVQTEGNSPRGQLATRYLTAVNTLKEEFANLANGGYAPTEPAWKLANEQIDGNYGADQLKASLGEVQRLIRYRVQAIPNFSTMGPGAANQYTGNPGTAPQTQPAGRPQPASVPSGAVDYLRAHPEARGDFERKYGAGSSASVLGQ